MKKFYLSFLLILQISPIFAQNKETIEERLQKNVSQSNRSYMRIMFYNVENLYDTYNDTLKNDEEFLPDGDKHWTPDKYYTKINNICKVITAVGGWDPPEIVGLCEIENRYVLDGIVKYTPLKKWNYQIIHKESPDARGVDVGLLYIKGKFNPIVYDTYEVNYPWDSKRKTRDILYVCGTTSMKDTLHIFVNHWPSRWGGQMESEENRIFVAGIVRQKVDSIFTTNTNANILIMGDLNDYPVNKSITHVLKANSQFKDVKNNELYNLSYYLQEVKGIGSHKYQGEWGILDQMIISGTLLNQENTLHTTADDAHIFSAPFLLEQDEQYVGFKPFRTYMGFKYLGGFADHLPVYLDLKRK